MSRAVLGRRHFVQGMCVGGLIQTLPSWAGATTARALSLSELVGFSTHVIIGRPTGHTTRWETAGSSRRIVTYSTVQVLQPLDGQQPPEEAVTVRTLGGRVGDFGQLVHGSPKLRSEATMALFLSPDDDGVMSITAMAQGHYPIEEQTDQAPRLTNSPEMPRLLLTPDAAVRTLARKTVVEAEQLVCDHRFAGR